MFAIKLRQIYITCDKIIIRNLRNRRYQPPNPGLDKRINTFREDGLAITENNAEEFIEQSESEFFKVGEQYKEHLNETLMGKHDLRHRIVKEKYFKENMPNLLTWSEKEQIRLLATEYPDEWTPEKLAESFPVTVPIVKKLLKYPWKPATMQRIARHDESCMRNWRELKDGTLDIPKDLRDHFLKFSERSIPPVDRKSVKIDVTPKDDKMGEFEKIVQNCAANENTAKQDKTNNYTDRSQENVMGETVMQDKKRITLDELTSRIKQKLEKGKNVNMPDQIILNSVNSKQNIEGDIQEEIELFNEDNNKTDIVEYKQRDDDAKNIMNYPERIRIPKKAYKKGATYKVDDCYYDHDGKFLYRVLGMTN